METVVIVGLGLIGGSFGLALRKAGFSGRIIGVSSESALREATARGVIGESASLEEAVPRADLVYLAQPIGRIVETLPALAPLLGPNTLVTDVGSTKRKIVACASAHLRNALFVGGHPMAGKEARGVAAADPDLFVGRPYFLTPIVPDHLLRPPVATFLGILDSIGARRLVIPASVHDQLVAATSHLPQLLSTALACVLARQPNAHDLATSAGPGLIDSMRLAMSSFDIWSDILETNSDLIDRLLAELEAEIGRQRKKLLDSGLSAEFAQANQFAARVRGPR
jgi:prephenate dehydrogenase